MKRRSQDTTTPPTSERPVIKGATADYAFWRNLEARFRALQPHDSDGLMAEWDSISRRWLPRGAPSDSVLRRFEQAAAYAAKMKGYSRGGSARDSWLRALKAEPHVYHLEGESAKNVKGGKVRYGEYGTIHRVCEVSADYCGKLAEKAYAREKQAQQAQPRAKDLENGGGTERRAATEETTRRNDRKGDPKLLDGKDRVNLRTAEQYLGISDRQRQNLIQSGALVIEGKGYNRKITTKSLRSYLPQENPK